ncbi:MAG TPA: iron donor protein CyaY [Alphaproteobacteria bacterium]|nr:iron donor protein CyaY [Alphaproteobacteria bacterium]
MSFNKISDEIIEMIFDYCEENNIEVDILNGVLYINSAFGQYVINKHNVTSQIWVSSPRSGAHKFSYNEVQQLWGLKEKELYSLIISELA